MEIGSLAQWAGATATTFAVLVALFKDEFLRWCRKPELRVSVTLAPPHCHKTEVATVWQTDQGLSQIRSACYYLRVWVENLGKTHAERVQAFAARLTRRSADGSFRDVEEFLPMNLLWSHAGSRPPEVFAQGISPQMGKHCDLGHVVDPKFLKDFGYDLENVGADQTVLALDLEVKPRAKTHLVPPGVYQLTLRVAAANCRPQNYTLELTITGKWFADESRMFSDGLGINLIK